MPRVISLIPSATEIVCALGLRDQLVGRSHECDFPSFVKKLPVCSSPAFDLNGSSRQVDERVKNHLKSGAPLFNLDGALIASLKPDVILTQSHCDVCAATPQDILRALGADLPESVRVISLQPKNLTEVWTSIQQVGDALGAEAEGRRKIDMYRSKVAAIRSRAESLSRPRVAALEWIDPLMAAGNWIPELIDIAGGKNLFGNAGAHSPWISWEELKRSDPEVILVLPCGYDIEKSRLEMTPLTQSSGWYDLKAVHNNSVFLLDGNQYFNRPGPRIVESAEILAEILHPEEFDFGHKHEGWQYWGFNRVV